MKSLLSFLNRFFSPALPKDSPPWYRARLTMTVSGLTLSFYFLPELIAHLFAPLDPVSLTEALITEFGQDAPARETLSTQGGILTLTLTPTPVFILAGE